MTDFCSCGWITSTRLWHTMGDPLPAAMVSVTGTLTSWKSPEFSIVTTNARSDETFTVVGAEVERSTPCGVARVETIWSPCLPLGVPPVDAPCRFVYTSVNARALTRSGFEMNRELGTTTPVTPTFFSCWVAGRRKSWSQTTSLALRSAALRRQRLCGRGRVLHRCRAREHVGETGEALGAQRDRVDEVLVDGAERPRRADLLRLVVRLLLLLRVLLERRLELRLLQRRRAADLVQELVPEPAVVDGHRPHLVHVGRVLGLLALALAGADPRDEHDHEDDGDGDEPGETDERDDAGRGRPRRLLGTVALAASGPAGQTAARRGLLRLRLVEEVELDVVVVVGAHGPLRASANLTPLPPRIGGPAGTERRVRPGRQPVGGVCRTPRLRWR